MQQCYHCSVTVCCVCASVCHTEHQLGDTRNEASYCGCDYKDQGPCQVQFVDHILTVCMITELHPITDNPNNVDNDKNLETNVSRWVHDLQTYL